MYRTSIRGSQSTTNLPKVSYHFRVVDSFLHKLIAGVETHAANETHLYNRNIVLVGAQQPLEEAKLGFIASQCVPIFLFLQDLLESLKVLT